MINRLLGNLRGDEDHDYDEPERDRQVSMMVYNPYALVNTPPVRMYRLTLKEYNAVRRRRL